MALVPLGEAGGRTAWTVMAGDRSLAVFVSGGRCYVTDGRCPHNGGPLAQGWIRNGRVICPWHWYRFELGSGRCETAPELSLRRYPVVERGGELFADVPEAEPARSWSQILRAHARGEG